jgi:signal transduction histidine kinase
MTAASNITASGLAPSPAQVGDQIESDLRQAEKMELLGRLALGLTHDFNNLLTGVLLYCDLLLAELEPDHRLRRTVEGIRSAGEQGSALTRQLLATARRQPQDSRPVVLNEIVTSCEPLLRRLIGEHIEVEFALDLAGFGAVVLADPAQVSQIVLNLALNARDAVGPQGKIRLRTQRTALPRARSAGARPAIVHETQGASALPAISLIVEDNGCGMSEETQAHIFDPFFTTKSPGEGTGMGLDTVRRIVNELGGDVEVESMPGLGTTVQVFFPIHAAASSKAGGLAGSSLFPAERSAPRPPDCPQPNRTGDPSC